MSSHRGRGQVCWGRGCYCLFKKKVLGSLTTRIRFAPRLAPRRLHHRSGAAWCTTATWRYRSSSELGPRRRIPCSPFLAQLIAFCRHGWNNVAPAAPTLGISDHIPGRKQPQVCVVFFWFCCFCCFVFLLPPFSFLSSPFCFELLMWLYKGSLAPRNGEAAFWAGSSIQVGPRGIKSYVITDKLVLSSCHC